jgi:hypothetical protein
LTGPDGKPIAIAGLWALIPGNDGNAGSSEKIYFTAGPNDETNGLFGVLEVVPEPSSMALGLSAATLLAGPWTWKSRKRRAND